MLWSTQVLVCLMFVHNAHSLCTNTATAERIANAVVLKFYRAQVDEWTSEGNSAKVAVQVSDKANTYCAANSAACNLETCCVSNFKETDVGTSSGYPKNILKDMELQIYIDIPVPLNSTGSTSCVLSKAVVQNLVAEARDAIHTETGHWITYIDDDFQGIPPAHELNRIIIPIAFAVLLALAFLTLGLNLWKKKKDSDARRMKIIEDRKKHSKAKVQPVYDVETTKISKIPPGVDAANGKPEKKKRKDQMYKDNLRLSQTDGKGSKSSTDSGVRVDSDAAYQRQGYRFEKKQDLSQGATGHDGYDNNFMGYTNQLHSSDYEKVPLSNLTPIQQVNPDTESPEKKKKKKKKRSKSKENMMGSADNVGQDNGAYEYYNN